MLKMCCTPSSSSSASNAAELVATCEDLLREILLRVPARSLVRLRSVSRQWLFLIADPEFRLLHVAVHRSPSAVLLRPSTSSAHYLLLPLSLDPTSDTQEKNKAETESSISLDLPSARVVQSCNGLLLCSSRRGAGPSPDYCVFNPTTQEYSLIPEPGVCRTGSRIAVFGLALAFDPSRSPFYKAVCVRGAGATDYRHQIEVYSSKDREWMVCGSPFTAPFDMVFGDGIFWNGAIHWLSPTGASLFFDIDSEVLDEMPRLPDIAINGGNRSSRRFRYFGHSGGHLHFFEIYGSMTAKFRVFEMQSDYSGWLPKYDIDFDPIICGFPEMAREHRDMCGTINYYAFSVLLLVREESKEKGSSASIIIHVPGNVLSYDINNKTFEKIYEIPPSEGNGYGKLNYGWLDAYEFIETLAPV